MSLPSAPMIFLFLALPLASLGCPLAAVSPAADLLVSPPVDAWAILFLVPPQAAGAAPFAAVPLAPYGLA